MLVLTATRDLQYLTHQHLGSFVGVKCFIQKMKKNDSVWAPANDVLSKNVQNRSKSKFCRPCKVDSMHTCLMVGSTWWGSGRCGAPISFRNRPRWSCRAPRSPEWSPPPPGRSRLLSSPARRSWQSLHTYRKIYEYDMSKKRSIGTGRRQKPRYGRN